MLVNGSVKQFWASWFFPNWIFPISFLKQNEGDKWIPELVSHKWIQSGFTAWRVIGLYYYLPVLRVWVGDFWGAFWFERLADRRHTDEQWLRVCHQCVAPSASPWHDPRNKQYELSPRGVTELWIKAYRKKSVHISLLRLDLNCIGPCQ